MLFPGELEDAAGLVNANHRKYREFLISVMQIEEVSTL